MLVGVGAGVGAGAMCVCTWVHVCTYASCNMADSQRLHIKCCPFVYI